MRAAISGTFAVVRAGIRLWGRHWPVLLTIALLGAAVRMGSIWAATVISDHNNTLGFLVLVLAPLGSVTAIVLMLYSLRSSLPHVSSIAATADPRQRRLIDMLASVLVPFLAVYASYGYLREDIERFINAAVADEFLANGNLLYRPGSAINTDRFVFATGWLAVAIVAGAILLRFGLGKLEGLRGWVAIGFVGAYVEVFWLTTLAAQVTLYKDRVWDWVEGRQANEIFVRWWDSLLDRIGPVSQPVDTGGNWLLGVLGNFDAIVVVPVAWLTVGAVVYGHTLVPPEPEPDDSWLTRLPRPVRRWGGELIKDLRDRFIALFAGLRQMAIAGLAPMLIFGLAFLASARLEDGLNLLARAVIGPQPVDTWLAFSPHVSTLTRAIGLTVTICLLAAAVDRVLASAQPPRREPDPEPESEPAPDLEVEPDPA
jgi:hypothetical protein